MPGGTFDQGTFDSGTFDDPLLQGGGLARLLGYAPRWLQGPVAGAVFGAIAQQLDDRDSRAIADQLFVATATWGLAFDVEGADGGLAGSGWERDYGIGVVDTDGLETRRARVLAARRGHAIRNDADFIAFVRAALRPAATADPTTYVHPGLYVVYKPADRGWVNLVDVEAALAAAGPAHLLLVLAPHREAPDTGLTDDEMDLMHDEALDVLTDAEWDGG